MPSTVDQTAAITRTLNQVKNHAQARAAVGAALKAISPAYELASDLPSERRAATSKELNQARANLEAFYREIKDVSAAMDVTTTWNGGQYLGPGKGGSPTIGKRKLVERAYSAIAGVEGEAHYVPRTSNLQILTEAIAQAPSVFTSAVGQVAGQITKEAGKVVGGAAAGIFSGLGISGVAVVIVVLLVVVVVLKRGTILGRVLS